MHARTLGGLALKMVGVLAALAAIAFLTLLAAGTFTPAAGAYGAKAHHSRQHRAMTAAQCKKKFKHNKRKARACVKNAATHKNREQARREEIQESKHPGTNGYQFAHEPPPAGNPSPKCTLKTRYTGIEEGDPQDFTVKQKYNKSQGSLAVEVTVFNPKVVICYAAITTLYLPPGASTMEEKIFFLKIKPQGGTSSSVTLSTAYTPTSYMAYGKTK